MRERIEKVLEKVEAHKKALLLAGASAALTSFVACNNFYDLYAAPPYSINLEDAGYSPEDSGLDDVGNVDR